MDKRGNWFTRTFIREPGTSSPVFLSATPDSIKPPSRSDDVFTPESAMSLEHVYRSVQILQTVVGSLEIDVYRDGVRLPRPLVARQPDGNRTRTDFLRRTVFNLAVSGEAFWLITRDSKGQVQNLENLEPNKVGIEFSAAGVKSYRYTVNGRDRTYSTKDVEHLRLMEMPGHVRGLGPIQMCRSGLSSAKRQRDEADTWTQTTMPNGVLTSPHANDPNAREALADAVYSQLEDGGILVLSENSKFQSVQFSPADIQYIEGQKFNATRIASLFGIPASWLLVDEGDSSYTYTNLTSINTTFAQITLGTYLDVMEGALSVIFPRGQEVKFNLDNLLRGDETTRFTNYRTALDAGFMTVDEVRAREGLDPLPVSAPTTEDAA